MTWAPMTKIMMAGPLLHTKENKIKNLHGYKQKTKVPKRGCQTWEIPRRRNETPPKSSAKKIFPN